eukprot:gene2697-2997_t
MADEQQHFDEQEQYEGDGMDTAEGHEETADELEAMKQKLKELEEEAAKLRNTQGAAAEDGEDDAAPDSGSKEEADSRSVFVNNVDWGATPEELQQHFATCGTVNRVTILTDKFGNPKGFAYIEFLELDAVDNAIMLDNSELRGRQIKVMRKRTNVPGMKRGRGRGRHGGFYGPPRGRGYYGGYGYGGYGYGGYGYNPRGRGRGRGRGFAPY